jgi:hypothetical protein
MTEPQTGRDAHVKQWLDELGPMSKAMRALVSAAVIDGDWMLHERTSYSLVLRRYDHTAGWPAPYDEIVIHRTSGRFTGARRYHATPTGNTRRLDDVTAWIGGEP